MTQQEIEQFVKTAIKSYRLVCVSARANNNKYWFADVGPDGRVLRRYARVGYNAQTTYKSYPSTDAAIRATDKDAQKKRNYSGDKEPYVDMELTETQTNALVDGRSLEDMAKSQIAQGNPELEKLISFFVQRNIHQITTKTTLTYSNGRLSTPLGIVTQGTIARARDEIGQIASIVEHHNNTNDNGAFVRAVERYLSLVPEKINGRVDPQMIFSTSQDVENRIDLLDAMESIVVSDDDTQVVTERIFSLKLEKVTDKKVISRIAHKFESTINDHHHNVKGMRLRNVWAINIDNDQFDDSVGNVKELWHGTKASNVLAILKSGLKIIKSGSHTTGKMYGCGLYFSDQSTKSLNYSGSFWGGRDEGRYFMFLVDVAMGREYMSTSSLSSSFTGKAGYDSTFARAGRSGVLNNEMIVYKEDRAKIRYLCEFS